MRDMHLFLKIHLSLMMSPCAEMTLVKECVMNSTILLPIARTSEVRPGKTTIIEVAATEEGLGRLMNAIAVAFANGRATVR